MCGCCDFDLTDDDRVIPGIMGGKPRAFEMRKAPADERGSRGRLLNIEPFEIQTILREATAEVLLIRGKHMDYEVFGFYKCRVPR